MSAADAAFQEGWEMAMDNMTLEAFCAAGRVTNLSDWTDVCRHVDIGRSVPLHYAQPLYGYVLPLIVALTLVTNSFIVIVLAQRHLRTPTNAVLLAMAVAELSTGLVSTPWFVYYYTLGGHVVDSYQGLPEVWCRIFPFLAFLVPTICHTAAIWLTVYLAVQRYVYVCVPSLATRFCTPGKSRAFIAGIVLAAAAAELPKLAANYNRPQNVQFEVDGRLFRRRFCVAERASWLKALGPSAANVYYASFYLFQAIFVHIIPCLLMAVFTAVLIRAIRVADKRRRRSLFRGRAESIALQMQIRENQGTRSERARHDGDGGTSSCMRYFHSTTQMLVVVILIFLATEIPVAIIFVLHFLIQSGNLSIRHYGWINAALIFRNLLILVSYPVNFAIYCGMSQQFRLTVRQLFVRQALYVQQPEPVFRRGAKRYSVLLVDINEYKKGEKMRWKLKRSGSRLRRGISRGLSLKAPKSAYTFEDGSRLAPQPAASPAAANEISSNGMITYHSTTTDSPGLYAESRLANSWTSGEVREKENGITSLGEVVVTHL